MPRGGNHKADGFSPHKHSDGRVLKILKSSQSKTGYQNIVKLRGSFWAKKKLDAEPGSKKARFFGKSDTCASGARTQDPPLPHPSLLYPSPSGKSVLPGPRTLLSFPAVCGRVRPPLSPTCVFESHCGRARGAGLNLALFEDEPYELPAIVPRKHTEKYDVEKKEKRAEALMAEAAELLGMSPDEPPEPGQSGGPRLLRDPTVALDFMVECEAVEVAAAPAGAAAAVPTVDFAYAIDTAHMEHVHMYGM